jgi:hypothetical protein
MRIRLFTLGVMVIAAAFATSALAASPHFKRGGTPTCTVTSTTVTCSGSLAGLGNEDVRLILTASAEASFNCVNPGGNISPGQNKVLFTASASQDIPANELKNGNLSFSISAPGTAPTATPQQAGCPNGNWSTQLASIVFGNVTLVIQQPIGTTIFTCTGSPNGQLSCS